ncbi:hypothetical protein RFI_31090 [Reticulomyxa filosa]|uniref:Mitochondria-eating protein C-terminal domain-containing protein n=1 Tax=Reticulomyxa filosa TaxID=46433 RepID=X6LXF8_RETFI|nr:hypothetical protein RFI_31090 [Reticulomyxa filosa]|eukprot:ETO06309.1 hypothetical protein RFI_31090 [Reticulomyxa filosa]
MKLKKYREVSEKIRQFIDEVKKWSWHAILQEPELELFPQQFKMVDRDGQRIPFNERIHKKTHGSDGKSQLILYCVWPSLRQQGCANQDVHIEVVVRDNLQGQTGATPNPNVFQCLMQTRIGAIQQPDDIKKDNNTVKTKQLCKTIYICFVFCFGCEFTLQTNSQTEGPSSNLINATINDCWNTITDGSKSSNEHPTTTENKSEESSSGSQVTISFFVVGIRHDTWQAQQCELFKQKNNKNGSSSLEENARTTAFVALEAN